MLIIIQHSNFMLRETMSLKQLQEELEKHPDDEQLKRMIAIKQRNQGQALWQVLRDSHN